MEKKDLLLEINEIKKKIVANSKDAHFAKTLTDNLVQKVKEWKHAPLMVADLGKEIDRMDGETFFIAKHENGVLFHGTNLYDFVLPYSVYADGMIKMATWLIDNKDTIKQENEDLQRLYNTSLLDFEFVFRLLITMWLGYEDTEKMKADVMERFYLYINNLINKSNEQPLQDETPEENAAFRDATLAMGEVKETLDMAKDGLKENE